MYIFIIAFNVISDTHAIYLIYISKAVKLMQDEDLLTILRESRSWNSKHGITGMLLYLRDAINFHQEGRFVQVLEGSEEEVRTVFEMIKRDQRHSHITVLNEGSIRKRHFKSWLMGFESMDIEEFKQRSGFFELTDAFLQTGNQQRLSVPLTFLKDFYTMSKKGKGAEAS